MARMAIVASFIIAKKIEEKGWLMAQRELNKLEFNFTLDYNHSKKVW